MRNLENLDARISELEAENARLRELACWQEDDAEPVGHRFLLSLEFEYESFGRNDGVYRRTVNDCRILVFPEVGDGHVELRTPNGGTALINESTSKGQLRRLIAALEGK